MFEAAHSDTAFAEAKRLMEQAQRRHQVYLLPFGETPREESELNAENSGWLETRLFPFLSETHLVLSGGDLWTGFDLLDPDGRDMTPTWRTWGDWLATWANQHWMSRPTGLGPTELARRARPWEYLDFYMRTYVDYLFEDYGQWADTALAVLRACEVP
ncbi:MAG: hypothetical protein JJ863_09950 [Deltaproteobacteria bacterium]|nr:hypothetical protein [Deltaproteobacteria bacterium]